MSDPTAPTALPASTAETNIATTKETVLACLERNDKDGLFDLVRTIGEAAGRLE